MAQVDTEAPAPAWVDTSEDTRQGVETIPPEYVPPVPTAPYVTNVVPSLVTPLFPHEAVSFDVLDPDGFRRILVWASFVGQLAPELIYDGQTFTTLYAAGSTVSPITDGFHFVLLRTGGWPSAPTITPYAFDTTGQENP